MKRVIFVRHAKSDWNDPSVSDHDRTLNKRGERDAPEMGRRIAERGERPGLLVSSSATRALTTARLMAETMGVEVSAIREEPRLYLADVSDMLEVLHELSDTVEVVCLFAHNPGMTDAAVKLGGFATANLPTCGVFCIDFDTDAWSTLGQVETSRVFFDAPKLG
jgi:phosphohistidine phosphatase